MLVEHFVRQLVVYVDLVFLVVYVKVIAVRQVFALGFFEEILAVLDGAVDRGQFVISVQLKIISGLRLHKKIQ